MFFRAARVINARENSFEIKSLLISSNGLMTIDPVLPSASHDAALIEKETVTLLPGMLDSHIHGYGGYDFANVNREQIKAMMLALGKTGLSYVMPTLISMDLEDLKKALRNINDYLILQNTHPMKGATLIVGIHLEGPYLAKSYCGAHDTKFLLENISNETFHQLFDEAPWVSNWKITLDPEIPGALDFIDTSKQRRNKSIKFFLGHCNPQIKVIQQAMAIDNISGFTHLGNACGEKSARAVDPLSEENLTSHLVQWVMKNPEGDYGVEIILDGLHLSQSFVMLLREKIASHLFFVSDALGPSGLKEGIYAFGDRQVIQKENVFYLATEGKIKVPPVICGSGITLKDCVKNYYRWSAQDPIEKIMLQVYQFVCKNPGYYSLSSHMAKQLLQSKNNAVFFNDRGELVYSLVNGEFQTH